MPPAGGEGDGRLLRLAWYRSAVPVADPAELREPDPGVALIQPELLRVRVAEGIRGFALLLELGRPGPAFLVVGESLTQVLERLLEWVDRHLQEPVRAGAVPPARQLPAQDRVGQVTESRGLPSPLEVEGLVPDEASGASEAPHVPFLRRVRPQPVPVGLSYLHGLIIIWPMDENKEVRRGRHCVFTLHVHLVFVTKYRRGVLDGAAVERLGEVFASVCRDFGAELRAFDGEDDHVHLLATYPPKVPLSKLVNSLKGVSSRLLRKERPDLAGCFRRGVLWSPSYFAASCGGAPLSVVREYVESQRTPA